MEFRLVLFRSGKARENRKAMPYVALPAFMMSLQRKPSFGRLALELLILSGVRSQEVRLATWAEFDLEARLWTIPADHMKRSKAHMAPLSDAALVVLAQAAPFRLAGSDVVFPGVAGKPMSDMTLLKVPCDMRSAESRVGKEWGRTCRSRGWVVALKKK